jgi:hypothetical protein
MEEDMDGEDITGKADTVGEADIAGKVDAAGEAVTVGGAVGAVGEVAGIKGDIADSEVGCVRFRTKFDRMGELPARKFCQFRISSSEGIFPTTCHLASPAAAVLSFADSAFADRVRAEGRMTPP